MNALNRVPLFPLETVLFPHTIIPLHVFEARYKELVIYCLEHDSPFGVVLIREGAEVGGGEVEPYEIGTLARIGRLRRLEDGRFQLLAVGEERFRIRQLHRELTPYLQADIEPWRDFPPFSQEEQQALTQAVTDSFVEFLRAVLEPYGLRPSEIRLPDDPVALSFFVAGALQASLPFKQYLLELQDTCERLRLLHLVLQEVAHAYETKPFNPDNWPGFFSNN
ncbi:MAG: LON peptidase substrate-binding domain-containing protein [Armatimonadota bacterium]